MSTATMRETPCSCMVGTSGSAGDRFEPVSASARMRPARLLESGFEFRFPQLDAVFKQALDQSQQTT